VKVIKLKNGLFKKILFGKYVMDQNETMGKNVLALTFLVEGSETLSEKEYELIYLSRVKKRAKIYEVLNCQCLDVTSTHKPTT
jgi:hypothetical protein